MSQAIENVVEWTPDEQLINRAGAELDVMIQGSAWSPLECLRRVFVPVLERVRADVKAAGVQIPPTQTGDFHVERGDTTLILTRLGDGSTEVEIYGREDKLTTYLEADDSARLKGWL